MALTVTTLWESDPVVVTECPWAVPGGGLLCGRMGSNEPPHSLSFTQWGSELGAGAAAPAPMVAGGRGFELAPAARSIRYPLAGWWSRVGALLVDGLLLALPFMGAVIVFHQYTKSYYIAANGTIATQYTAHSTWIESLLWLGYVLIVMCRVGNHNGQTFGKQATKIRVVRNDGKAVDIKTVLVREGVGKMLPGALGALSHVVLAIVLTYFLLDYLWPLWERENRALHDLLARTHVVFRDEPVRDFEAPWPADAAQPQSGVAGS